MQTLAQQLRTEAALVAKNGITRRAPRARIVRLMLECADALAGADADRARLDRLHPHCTLQLARSIAPDHFWFWSVTMPDGHVWAIKGGMSFEEAAASMYAEGLTELLRADGLWREDHPVLTDPLTYGKSHV